MGSLAYDNALRRFTQADAGREVWRTDAPPAFLLSAAATLAVPVTMSFPDFPKGNAMYMDLFTVDDPQFGDFNATGGQCWCVIRPGEWGPGRQHDLPRILLGTAPAGCNYLEVTANLTCTKAPTLVMGVGDFRYGFPEGQEINLDGGCAILERQQQIYMRGFRVVLIGTQIWLEMFQTVKASTDALISSFRGEWSWKSGAQSYDGSPISNWDQVWTDDGDRSGWIAAPMSQATGGNLFKMRGGANAPSSVDTTDFSSVWAGTLTIRPGYVKPS